MPDPAETTPLTIIPLPSIEVEPVAAPPALPDPPPQVIEAEWVQRYAPRRVGEGWRWLGLLLRWIVALALTWLFYAIPPTAFPDPFQNWKNPVVIALLVCYIGKSLLDTLFYDPYQP